MSAVAVSDLETVEQVWQALAAPRPWSLLGIPAEWPVRKAEGSFHLGNTQDPVNGTACGVEVETLAMQHRANGDIRLKLCPECAKARPEVAADFRGWHHLPMLARLMLDKPNRDFDITPATVAAAVADAGELRGRFVGIVGDAVEQLLAKALFYCERSATDTEEAVEVTKRWFAGVSGLDAMGSADRHPQVGLSALTSCDMRNKLALNGQVAKIGRRLGWDQISDKHVPTLDSRTFPNVKAYIDAEAAPILQSRVDVVVQAIEKAFDALDRFDEIVVPANISIPSTSIKTVELWYRTATGITVDGDMLIFENVNASGQLQALLRHGKARVQGADPLVEMACTLMTEDMVDVTYAVSAAMMV